MRSILVLFSMLILALGLTADSPLSAQRIDTRFSAADLGARTAVVTFPQRADSLSESSVPPFWSMAIASTIGGGTGMLLGGLAGEAVGAYADLSDLLFWGAIGTTVGTFLGVGIAGSDHGVNPFEALFSGVWGFAGGVAMANLLDDRTSGVVLVGGFITAQALTAATVGWLFAD